MYKSMFPTRNNEIAPYKKALNNASGIYFSANAKVANTEKPTATKAKYMFFLLFNLSLGIDIPFPFSAQNANDCDASYHARPEAEIECAERHC